MPRAKQKTAASRGRSKRATGKSAKVKAKSIAAESAETDTGSVVATDAAEPGQSSTALMLPDCLDASAAATVKEMLLARRGAALVVDASQVRRIGAQSLQVMVAAARTWQADGLSYCVSNSSSELLETIALIGLSREDLMLEGAMQ